MTDDIEAITETAKAAQEIAKASGKAIDLTGDFGAYIAEILGDVPTNLVGLLGGDYLGQVRLRNLDKFVRKTKRITNDRGAETEPIALSIAVPLLGAAQDESRDELQDMWARLLANALDNNRNDRFRLEFVGIIKQLNPVDALALDYLNAQIGSVNTRDMLRAKFGLSEATAIVSLQHLVGLELAHNVDQSGGVPQKFVVSWYGRELCRACEE